MKIYDKIIDTLANHWLLLKQNDSSCYPRIVRLLQISYAVRRVNTPVLAFSAVCSFELSILRLIEQPSPRWISLPFTDLNELQRDIIRCGS